MPLARSTTARLDKSVQGHVRATRPLQSDKKIPIADFQMEIK